MNFCRLQDTYSFGKVRRLGLSVDAFYRQTIRRCGEGLHGTWRQNADFQMDMLAEWNWWKAGRPYYNVWPAITETLDQFDVSKVPFQSFLSAPEPHIVIQFPAGGHNGSACILVSVVPAGTPPAPEHHLVIASRQLVSAMPNGEYPTATDMLTIPVGGEKTTWDDCDPNVETPRGPVLGDLSEVRIAIAVLLMERSPEMFEPVVLAADRRKYEQVDAAGRERIADRAVRRHGQRGYHLGRAMETIPHYRRPHPALYWTGKGRSVARIVFRQGSIVKRKVLTSVPTGRLGGEETIPKGEELCATHG